MKPTCTNVTSVAMAATSPSPIGGTTPEQATAQPTLKWPGWRCRPRARTTTAPRAYPTRACSARRRASADEHPFLAAAVLTLVAGLLIAMLALVTRFLRGSWNP